MTIAEMRAILGLGPDVPDAEVVAAYVEWAGLGAALSTGDVVVPYDPIGSALDAHFDSMWSLEAVFTPPNEPPLPDPIRVIRSQPDEVVSMGQSAVIQGTNIFEMRLREVLAPKKGATLTIAGRVFQLKGEAMLDVEGLTWRMGAVAA